MHERDEMHTKFWSEKLKGIDCLENVGTDERIILEWILEKEVGMVWTGFIWIRAGTSGELL
jgi:hypothetical protein